MTPPALTERQIHRAVITRWKALGRKGTLIATIPNAGAMGQAGLTKGLPDLIVFGPDGVHAIELKTLKGKATVEQLAVQDTWRSTGCRHEVCHGLDAAIATLEDQR